MIRYTARITNPLGVYLTSLGSFSQAGGAGLEYTIATGRVGVLKLTVPDTFDDTLFKLDGRIGIWRSIHGADPYLDGDTVFFVRKWEYHPYHTTVTAYSANELLRRRIIAYASGSAQSVKGPTYSDDELKEFASENLGSGISASTRDGGVGNQTGADLTAYLTIQTDASGAVQLSKDGTRRSLEEIAQALCEASTLNGTYLTYDIVATSETTLELRTYTRARGVDHRAGSNQPVILSPQRRNLENAVLTIDRTNEINFVVAAGQGTGANRITAFAQDLARINESPFNRREFFRPVTQLNATTTVQAEADAMVRAGRPIIRVEGDLIETEGTIRGKHFDLGDMLTTEVRGRQNDVRLDAVHVSISVKGQTSRAILQSVS